MDIVFWMKLGLSTLFVGGLLVGFWRGLSLKPTPIEGRPPPRMHGPGLF